MKKIDVAQQISQKTGLTFEQSLEAVDAFTDIVINSVASKKSIFIRGFGAFIPVLRKEKLVRNISKNEGFICPAHYKPVFKPYPNFKDAVK